ncbi:unnamed protein product [Caenorhabditis bovis]|uniref:non-specific serine/threonine protein kinase n=1 Tax=Caenorhabditis bovis TaxID=2654633 RepID=A0A8S1EXU5_9PELO|nr:unnamed protein product [Caenorhabditis bovis]
MVGALKRKIVNPPDYAPRLLRTERPDLYPPNATLENDECVLLDAYLRAKGELRSMEIVVMKASDNVDEKKQDLLRIINKYSEGRFGAIYTVQRVASIEEKVVYASNMVMIMKTSLRQSACSTNRLSREIAALKVINDTGKGREPVKRVLPILFESKVLGIPYFIMPPMDVSLEKMKTEICRKMTLACAFFIAQEVLMGIKDVHAKRIVHRDVKPANVVLNPVNNNQWYLIDFGDAIMEGRRFLLSPPDGITLPFLSLVGHQSALELIPAECKQDIESWFYLLMDLVKPLSWRKLITEPEVIEAKKDFWLNKTEIAEGPEHLRTIAELIERGVDYPYKEISLVLKDGFEKHKY